MTEFWESSFKEKKEMWGWEPSDSAIATLEFFKEKEISKILIPGFGYGRNGKIFLDNGFEVTGIEISETAIDIAKNQIKNKFKIYSGSVNSMPFDEELYDGIFSYALLHLLNREERIKFLHNCFNQLKPNGHMIFVSLSKTDFRYGQGEQLSKDSFKTNHGVTLFFYDLDSIQLEFAKLGLQKAEEIEEPKINFDNKPIQKFWYIICKKD